MINYVNALGMYHVSINVNIDVRNMGWDTVAANVWRNVRNNVLNNIRNNVKNNHKLFNCNYLQQYKDNI